MLTECALGVGCDEYGMCYAAAMNYPEQCGRLQMSEKASRTKSLGDERFTMCMAAEAHRARQKFPSTENMALAALEEAGEVVKALLDRKQGKGTTADIYKECVQAAAMFMRIATEGDDDTGYYGYSFNDFRKIFDGEI